MSGFAEYEEYDALGLSELVDKGEVSPTELVEACISRIERLNPRLNAVVHTLFARARQRARGELPKGPLSGVPMVAKDLLQHLEGTPLSSGCRAYRDQISDHTSELMQRYLDAGLIVVARSASPEFGLMPATEPELYGPAENPWKPGYSAGGSSGGSAICVASGIVPVGHGGDGGGSIRIPASCCGIFGLKPTRARTPTGPRSSEGWDGFAIEHVVSRTVRDSAAFLDATHGTERGAPYAAPAFDGKFVDEVGKAPGKLRIAFHTDPALAGEVHPDCVAATHEAAALCEELGHEVEEVRPGHQVSELARAFFNVVCGHTFVEVTEAARFAGRKPSTHDFETSTYLLYLLGSVITAGEYVQAQKALQAETRRLAERYRDYDVVLTPTLGQPPGKHGFLRAHGAEALLHEAVARLELGAAFKLPGIIQQAAERTFGFIPFTPVANFTGQPSMSVPLHWNRDGLPVGVMFTGRFGDEALLYRLAGQLETARPWRDRRPAL